MAKRRLFLVPAVAIAGICVAGVAAGSIMFGRPGPTRDESRGANDATTAPGNGAVQEAIPVSVTVEPACTGAVQRTVAVLGSLYGREELAVSAKVEGSIRRIHHDVGEEVKAGALLLELDPTDAELAVSEAQKSLELELAKLGLKAPPQESFDVSTLPTVARAAAKDKYATSKQERASKMRAAGSMAVEEFQQAEFEFRDAREAHRQARLDAETTLAAVRQRQAGLDSAKQRLKDTRIFAPSLGRETSDGPVTYVIAQRTVSEGEMVRPGTAALLRLVVADTLKLQAAVPERHHGEVKMGQTVKIRVEAFPRETFQGKVSRVNPTVDRSSRTFQIEVSIPNANLRLAPGSFARADVQTRLDSDAILVPEEALVAFAGLTKVFVLRDGKAAAVVVRPTDVRIETGKSGQPRLLAEVAGAVRPGDQVVTSGQSKLIDGASVRVRSATGKGDNQ